MNMAFFNERQNDKLKTSLMIKVSIRIVTGIEYNNAAIPKMTTMAPQPIS